MRGFEDLILPLRIFRDGHPISENTEVSIVDGVGKVEFTDRISRVGSYNYSAKILPAKDAHPGNNKANRWIEITGGPRILLISKYTDDPVAAVLRKQGFTVEVVSDSLSLRVGQLSGTRAVILNNVPAFEMPGDFLNALEFFVKEQGGGLMMAGGKQSFGSGGYFESAVDPLLPVSMELKSEHRKLAVAMAIVMDRSGSMGMTVPAGGKNATKMQLANTGASKAIELLGAQDKITLFAVDSEPHEIIPLREIGNSKKKLMNLARKVKSTGGGIYVYRGLKAAWDELKKADSGTRHIILFSDARDSEQPGAYKTLLKEITANSGSVSVIGLGTRSDPDAALLEEIAKLGNGRIFFTNKPVDIPKLFAQETVTVARSAFIRDPVHTKATGHWAEISPKPFEFPPQVDGYNLSYPKDRNTTTSLVANDEYLGPLVAHASRGIGRSVAVSFPLGGEHSEKIRALEAIRRLRSDSRSLAHGLRTSSRLGTETSPRRNAPHRGPRLRHRGVDSEICQGSTPDQVGRRRGRRNSLRDCLEARRARSLFRNPRTRRGIGLSGERSKPAPMPSPSAPSWWAVPPNGHSIPSVSRNCGRCPA